MFCITCIHQAFMPVETKYKMSVTGKNIEAVKHNIDLEERIDLHKRGWKMQKLGWVIIFLIPLLGLLGLYGEGFLSFTQVVNSGFKTSYDRFFRYEKEMKILITSEGENISSISLPQKYINHFRIESIVPQPAQNLMIDNEIVYHFSGGGNRIVALYLVPEDYGNIAGTLKVNGHAFSLNHFIYP
jgi:hypothetical protein